MASLAEQMDTYGNKAADMADNLASGKLPDLTSAFGAISFWLKIFLSIGAVIVIIFIIYHYWFKYNKVVLIKKLKGNAVIDHKWDRAKEITDDRGKTKLQLFKTKTGRYYATCSIPPYSYTSKFGKRDFYILYQDDMGELHPCYDDQIVDKITGQQVNGLNVDIQIKNAWRLDERKLMEERLKKKSLLTQYLPEIIVVATIGISFLIVYFTMEQVGKMASDISGSLYEVAKAVQSLK